MFLSPTIRSFLTPKTVSSLLQQTRHLRPIVKFSKEKFQITLDMRQFDREEVRVKARPEFVIIEGKQERPTSDGYVIRQVIRKFKLPPGCNPEDMKSKMSPEGVLTITAKRKGCGMNFPCEKLVPINLAEENERYVEESMIPPKSSGGGDSAKSPELSATNEGKSDSDSKSESKSDDSKK